MLLVLQSEMQLTLLLALQKTSQIVAAVPHCVGVCRWLRLRLCGCAWLSAALRCMHVQCKGALVESHRCSYLCGMLLRHLQYSLCGCSTADPAVLLLRWWLSPYCCLLADCHPAVAAIGPETLQPACGCEMSGLSGCSNTAGTKKHRVRCRLCCNCAHSSCTSAESYFSVTFSGELAENLRCLL